MLSVQAWEHEFGFKHLYKKSGMLPTLVTLVLRRRRQEDPLGLHTISELQVPWTQTQARVPACMCMYTTHIQHMYTPHILHTHYMHTTHTQTHTTHNKHTHTTLTTHTPYTTHITHRPHTCIPYVQHTTHTHQTETKMKKTLQKIHAIITQNKNYHDTI